MKSIKYFQYKDMYEYRKFLDAYGYRAWDVIGFSFVDKKQYQEKTFLNPDIHLFLYHTQVEYSYQVF